MKSRKKLPLGKIIQGDALEVLRTFPNEVVHCVVTSPPYWGLRDYGEAGQGGLEETPEAHIAWIVEVMREVRRVLRSDGTCWLNYADAYRDKQLLGMPWRVALALQSDGWWIRSDIIWTKPNPMPESATDRPTSSHEHVFLLSKAARYFYDAEAVREANTPGSVERWRNGGTRKGGRQPTDTLAQRTDWTSEERMNGRNLRNVWNIATQPYSGAHFATFPEKLVEPCIKAGTSEKGCCAVCGTPWKRLVEVDYEFTGNQAGAKHQGADAAMQRKMASGQRALRHTQTIGWLPSCLCGGETGTEPRPCIVLDPFAGSGTTGVVAYRLGREFIGIDLAGGDKDMGGHTAHDRLEAARRGKDLSEVSGFIHGKRWSQETLL